MMRYTVIIPIYNAENKIGRALESVQKQTEKDLEIICINDGSEDNSGQIVQDYALNDSRIKLYSQQNKGAAVSRNFALDIAQGEYIAFLDADDAYDDKYALEKIYKIADINNAEICMAKIYSVKNGQKEYISKINDFASQKQKFRFEDFQYDFYCPTYIFKRTFLNDNKIRYPIKKIYEDPLFLIMALSKASYIYCVDVDYYNYFWERKETVLSLEVVKELLDGLLEVMEIAVNKNYHILKQEILNRVDSMYSEELWLHIKHPCILKRLIQLNDYSNKENFDILLLKYLIAYGQNFEWCWVKKYAKLKELSVRDQKVVLYAAGGAGVDCFELNKKYKEFELVAWIDKNKAGKIIEHTPIRNLEYIGDIQFDKIIVAIRNDQLYDEIVEKLMEMRIESNIILRWK
ncbi:MAG: glycosyltransferase family 2 protein [Lachnospiraceae bacterium]|nr:glycosyltransferase family 2 protein [Lachnospiraceae bacterium]